MEEYLILIRVCVVAVLTPAALAKLATSTKSPPQTLVSMVPSSLIRPLLLVLIAIEIALSVLLCLGAWLPEVLLVSALLFALFAAVGVRAQGRDDSVSCGCLGAVADLRMSAVTVCLNLLIAAACLLGALLAAQGLDTVAAETAAVAGASGLLLALIYWVTFYVASAVRKVNEALASPAVYHP